MENTQGIIMKEFNSSECNGFQDQQFADFSSELDPRQDLLAERILENVNYTPIGQLLKKIASMPEIRREKVITVRRQISHDQYDLNEHLDVALDKVLEELIL